MKPLHRTINDVTEVIKARTTQDGDGVTIHRIAGQRLNALLDPFLLVDEIRSDDSKDYVGGFPPHPHRGFQTLTYMLQGGFAHTDSMGNEGEVSDGGLQWMSAARGVIHSEMPRVHHGRLHGYQFWINLPQAHKMEAPDYRDMQDEEIPRLEQGAHRLSALIGEVAVQNGPWVRAAMSLPHTPVFLTDVTLARGEPLSLVVPKDTAVHVLVVDGHLGSYSKRALLHFAGLHEESALTLESDRAARILVFGGKALAEPIAQYGPFVMNTMEEVEQALRDYRDGALVR